MSTGKRVIVINSSPHYGSGFVGFPPIGTYGTVVSELDAYGEYDILFDGHPCPALPDPSWVTHKSMIVFVGEGEAALEVLQQEVLA